MTAHLARDAARRTAVLASVLGGMLAGCASGAGGAARPAVDTAAAPVADSPSIIAAAPADAAARIASAEQARIGSLRVLRARGVAEVRWRDASGDHFEQGDADLRWCDGRGIAVSVSKLGDRLGWFGSDGVKWWRFDLKSTPTRLVVGTASDGGGAGAGGVPSPRLLGLRALEPAPGSVPSMRDGVAWIELRQEGSARTEAGFHPVTLAPVAVRTVAASGAVLEASFDGLFAVDTAGAAPGAWPRIPRRVRLRVSGAAGGDATDLMLALDSAAADAEAADRDALYDLGRLRATLAPDVVEEAP